MAEAESSAAARVRPNFLIGRISLFFPNFPTHRRWRSVISPSGPAPAAPDGNCTQSSMRRRPGEVPATAPISAFPPFNQCFARQVNGPARSEEHTSELQSLMRISYAVFCLKKKNKNTQKQDQQNRLQVI